MHGQVLRRPTLGPTFASVACNGSFCEMRVDLERIRCKAFSEGASTIGISFVVMMVGQATLLPALPTEVRHTLFHQWLKCAHQATAIVRQTDKEEGIPATDGDRIAGG